MIWGVKNASPSADPESDAFRVSAAKGEPSAITGPELESVRPAMVRSASAILRRAEDVEDAVQEALLRILRSNTRVETSRGSLAAFACTTVRRVALDQLARRTPLATGAIDDSVAPPPAVAEPLDAAHVKNRLRDAVDELPDAQRSAFLLVHQEGLSHAEAAQELRISHETLRSRLFRARTQLRHTLKDLRP